MAKHGTTPEQVIQKGLKVVLAGSIVLLVLSYCQTSALVLHASFLMAAVGVQFLGIVIALPCVLGESLTAYRHCLGQAGALFGAVRVWCIFDPLLRRIYA